MKDLKISDIIAMPLFEEFLSKEAKRLSGWEKEFYDNHKGIFPSMYRMAMNKTLSNCTARERTLVVSLGNLAFNDTMSNLLRSYTN